MGATVVIWGEAFGRSRMSLFFTTAQGGGADAEPLSTAFVNDDERFPIKLGTLLSDLLRLVVLSAATNVSQGPPTDLNELRRFVSKGRTLLRYWGRHPGWVDRYKGAIQSAVHQCTVILARTTGDVTVLHEIASTDELRLTRDMRFAQTAHDYAKLAWGSYDVGRMNEYISTATGDLSYVTRALHNYRRSLFALDKLRVETELRADKSVGDWAAEIARLSAEAARRCEALLPGSP